MKEIYPGQFVQIPYPEYATYLTGVVLGLEQHQTGKDTGAWLIQIETSDLIVALMPDEFEPLN